MKKLIVRGLTPLALFIALTSSVVFADEIGEICESLFLASGKSYPAKAEFKENEGFQLEWLIDSMNFVDWRTGLTLMLDYSSMDSSGMMASQQIVSADLISGKVDRIKLPPVNFDELGGQLEVLGRYAVLASGGQKFVYDTQTKKIAKYPTHPRSNSLTGRLGPDERPVSVGVRSDKSNVVDFFDVVSGKTVSWELSSTATLFSARTQGDWLAVLQENRKIGVFNIKTGKSHEIQSPVTNLGWMQMLQISQDGKRIYIPEGQTETEASSVVIVNSETGAVIQKIGSKDEPTANFATNSDGSRLIVSTATQRGDTRTQVARVYKSNSDGTYSVDYEFDADGVGLQRYMYRWEGEKTNGVWSAYSGTAEAPGKVRIIRQTDGKLFELDIKDLGDFVSVADSIVYDGGVIPLNEKSDQFLLKVRASGDSGTRVFYFHPAKKIVREVARVEGGDGGGVQVVLDKLGPVVVTGKEIIRLDLRSLADRTSGLVAKPKESSNTPTAIKRQISTWISKGFDPALNARRLVEMVVNKGYLQAPKEFAAISAYLAGSYPILFEQLAQKFPEWEASNRKVELTAADLKKPAFAAAAKAAKKYVQKKMDVFPETNGSRWIVWQEIEGLTPFLSKMKEEVREAMADSIAQSLANAAAGTPELEGVFISKIYKFTRSKLDNYFGFKPKNLTDFTWIRTADEIKPIILGVQAIDGETKENEYGFHVKFLPIIELTSSGENLAIVPESVLNWRHGSDQYSMNWSVTKMSKPIEEVILATPSANFESMWKDGKLTGMVIAGTNMGEDAAPTLDEYKSYYKSQGFKFGKATKVADTRKLIQEEVESGTMDYFLKEAHSDGDEKNLFRMSKASEMIVGKKKRKDGKEEVIQIVYPSSTDGGADSTLLSNQDFGEWIKTREKTNGVELVYYNASCWSESKVVNELEAAFSPIFRVLASTTTVTVFRDDPTQAEYQMLHQFRENEASWEKIREAMMRDPDYANASSDKMIFPDEPEYDERIRKVMKVPVAINTVIKDSAGKVYNIDEAH